MFFFLFFLFSFFSGDGEPPSPLVCVEEKKKARGERVGRFNASPFCD